MARINALNNSSGSLTIDSGASGDSFIQYARASVDKWRIGVDDDASDAFKIAIGSALGTSDAYIMSADGERTLPLQPGFLAEGNAEANASGDGTNHLFGSITAMTEVIDRTGDFSPGDGAGTGNSFTAPVDGRYLFTINATIDIDASGGDWWIFDLLAGGRTYQFSNLPTKNRVSNFFGINGWLSMAGSVIAQMDATDTAQFRIRSGTNSKTDDIPASRVRIGGFLVA